MNWIQFAKLMKTIYGKELPDIDYIQELGLLAIKIGQTYAVRVDFLPEAHCQELSKLFRATQQTPSEDLFKLLEKYCPPDWREAFEQIDEEPLASASVGQVHCATLKDSDKVAVKVVKDDFEERFKRDVRSLRRLLKIIIFFYRKLERVADPLGILASIEESTLSELDLRLEAKGQERLRDVQNEHEDTYDLSKLQFPNIYYELSNENVLVTELVEGRTFDELLETGDLAYEDLLDLFKIHGFYMFCVGVFHGDIHPGNIIRKDGKIYLLDTGAIATVSKQLRVGLFKFFDALSQFDYRACAKAMNAMATQKIGGDKFKRFEDGMVDLYSDFTDASVSEVSLTRRMMETIKLAVHSGMDFERGMYPVIKSLMYMDGMVLRCRPDAVLMHDMRPYIEVFQDHVKRNS